MTAKLGRVTARLPRKAALCCAIGLALSGGGPSIAQEPQASPIQLEAHADPFDYRSSVTAVDHVPLAQAARHWQLCAVFPHIKDEYWLSVAWGMAEESRRLGVGLTITETGGYRSETAQAERLRGCADDGANAAILGTVSYDGPQILQAISAVSAKIPVVAAVNDVASHRVAVKVGVSWREMGLHLGTWLARQHPAGSTPGHAVLATGPKEAGWVSFLSEGLSAGLAGSAVTLADTGWADTGTQEQRGIAEDLLERDSGIDLFIGCAPAVEAMVSLARARPAYRTIAIAATYYTHAVRRGMLRGRILAAPFDDPALQGRLAIEYAVRAIEGTVDHRQIGPRIRLVTQQDMPPVAALAPPDFRPEFNIP